MEQALNSLFLVMNKSGGTLLGLLPYVLSGVILSEILKLTSWTKLVYRKANNSPMLAVALACILGAVSPLCTYGTVPVVIQLYKAGLNLSPLVTFLSVSSMMNPQLFLFTWGGLGPEMAFLRLGTVLVFGLLLGAVLYRVPARWVIRAGIQQEASIGEEILQRKAKQWSPVQFSKDCLDNLQYIGFYLVLGVVLGAAVEVFVPARWIASAFRPGSLLPVFLAAILGVPLYACGGGTIFLLRSFIAQGMSPGAAFAFLTVGQATRITPLMALAALLRPVFILLYTVLLIVYSILIGLFYH